jgi:hypothetical protein
MEMTMRIDRTHPRTAALAAAVAGLLSAPGIASAQTKIYPPGTDCANQPTIAERLLCGRQEFRREHGLSVVQPTIVPEDSVPGSVDEPDPIPQPKPPAELQAPSQQPQMMQQPNTASPNH